jgi:hypothetical protein
MAAAETNEIASIAGTSGSALYGTEKFARTKPPD